MTDLSQLRDALAARGPRLELAATDTLLPQPLRDLLVGLPDGRLTVAPGPGLPVVTDSVLTLAGATTDSWPVTGFTGVAVRLASVTVTVTAADAVTVTATGAMDLAGDAVNVDLASVVEQGSPGWQVTLGAAVSDVRATQLLALGLGETASMLPVPDGLDALGSAVTLGAQGFDLSFFPGTGLLPRYAFVLSVPAARWAPVPSVLELDGLDIAASVVAGSCSVTLIGHVDIGGTAVDVRLGIVSGSVWTADIRPGAAGAFPGIADLIGWIGGTTGGVGLDGLGLDADGLDAAIGAVRITFDPKALTLDKVEIFTVLTLRALRFDITVRLPDLAVRGALHDGEPLGVPAVLRSFGLPDDGVPTGLTVTEASFSAQPSLSTYTAALALSGVWAAGPLSIESLGAALGYEPRQGLTCQVSGGISLGTSIELDLAARYDGADNGWTFTGTTPSGAVLAVGDLIDALTTSFGIGAVPQPLRDLSLTGLNVEYRTGTGAFTFTCEGDLDINGTPVSLVVDVAVQQAAEEGATGYSAEFGGMLMVGEHAFKVVFDKASTASRTFVATYAPTGAPATVSLRDLVAGLSADAAQAVPDGLSIGLESAVVAYVRPATATQGTFAVGLGASVGADLAKLPLVGDRLPAGATLSVRRLRFVYSSAALAAADLTAVNALLPPAVPALPPTTGGAQATVDLRIGTTDAQLRIGAAPTTADTGPTGNANAPAPAPAPATGSPTPTTLPGDNVTWYPVQRTLGPVTVDRIGFTLLRPPDADALVAFLLDASLAVAGLSLSLDGLSVGIAPGNLAAGPTFSLRGLGVAYSSGGVEIGGAFLKDTVEYDGHTYDSYNGKAVLRSGQFQLSALGSYLELPQGPSLFVYAALNYPIGGPPVFFVRGLAAGFGYNRRLIPPSVDKIATFPLVAEVMSPSSEARTTDVGKELRALRDYLPPSAGDFFLAVGLRFTSFQMIDSFLLLIVGFGHRFELNLLGLSTMELPTADTAATGVPPIVRVQLALQATLVPEDGFFGIRGQLTENSYLLSEDCRLTGGFAFQTWFGQEHTGDFVVSIGGYHPRFPVPTHYPAVPRVGFSWQVSPQLSMKGGAYFALTPSALMAGGSFSATWQDDTARAWFSASMDFLIGWKPYHYEASLQVLVGASYTFRAFGTHTVRVQVHAEVELWGPEFGGAAAIDIGPFTAHVSLGSTAAQTTPDPIKWGVFRTSFLPAAKDVVTVVLAGGASAGGGDGDGRDLGVVNALELALVTDCVVPSREARRGPDTVLPVGDTPTAFGIAPLGLSSGAGVPSTHLVEIRGSDGTDVGHLFDFTPVRKNLPSALWGDSLKPSLGAAATVPELLTGLTVKPKPPKEPAGTAPSLTRAALQDGTELFPSDDDAFRWLPPRPFTETGGQDALRVIGETIGAPDTAAARSAVAEALLGDDIPLDLTGFRTEDFRAVPRVAAPRSEEARR